MGNKEAAVGYFKKGFACSQAVLSAYSEQFGLKSDFALKVSSAFGGGVARRAETCGAVVGALMVIGLKYGNMDATDSRAKDTTYKLANEFITRFTDRHDSIVCKDLLEVDISTPEGHKAAKKRKLFSTQCPKYVEDAAGILDEIL